MTRLALIATFSPMVHVVLAEVATFKQSDNGSYEIQMKDGTSIKLVHTPAAKAVAAWITVPSPSTYYVMSFPDTKFTSGIEVLQLEMKRRNQLEEIAKLRQEVEEARRALENLKDCLEANLEPPLKRRKMFDEGTITPSSEPEQHVEVPVAEEEEDDDSSSDWEPTRQGRRPHRHVGAVGRRRARQAARARTARDTDIWLRGMAARRAAERAARREEDGDSSSDYEP